MIKIHSFGCHETIDDDVGWDGDDGWDDDDHQSQARRNFGPDHKNKLENDDMI